MPLLTTTAPTGVALSPEDRAALVLGPLQRQSIALRASTVIPTARDEVAVPLLTDDVPVDFVAEGAPLPQGEPAVAEVVLRPRKVAALTVLSRELARDSSPAAVDLVGESIARSIRRRLDAEFVAGTGGGIAPVGILTTPGVVTGAVLGDNLDAILGALTSVEVGGGTPDVVAMHPTVWGRLAAMKGGTGSNAPLLGDPTAGTGERRLFGVPVFVDASMPTDRVGVWERRAVAVALREDVTVAVDESRYFDTDSVAVRATLRASWAVLDPARVVTIPTTAPTA